MTISCATKNLGIGKPVASSVLPLGATITEAAVTTIKFPKENFVEGLYFKAIKDVVGKRVKYPLSSGIILTTGVLSTTPVGSFASSQIPPGYVAISIPITRLTSVSYPGGLFSVNYQYDPVSGLPTNVGDTLTGTRVGLLYHAAEYYGGEGRRDIYASSFVNGEFEGPPRLVGGDVSGEYDEADPLIARDGSWLVFVSAGRPGGFGAADLYVVFRNGDGSWSKARNLGGKVNTKAYEYSPAMSPDGRYFFFTRDGDIYWVKSKIVFDLKGGAL